MKYDVECCNFRHGVMWNVTEMQNVRCGIWRGVECCTMQDAESCDVMRNAVVWNCDEECGICNVLCRDCFEMSDVEATYVRCGGM